MYLQKLMERYIFHAVLMTYAKRTRKDSSTTRESTTMQNETVNFNDPRALFRVNDLCNNPKARTKGILNCSRSAFWNGVKEGTIPQPIYLGERLPLWRREDIEELLKNGSVKNQRLKQ